MASTSPAPTIGDHLRDWRQRRRMSQLDLALEAEVSARHLSFIETGRARPSRDMVLNLAERLGVPLREQNAMLLAAGYAPAFSENAFDSAALADARRAVETILAAHEPWPAIAVDRHWLLVAANAAVGLLLAGVDPALLTPPVNVLRIALHPAGMAARIVNRQAWSAHILTRLRRDAFATGDPVLTDLYRELSQLAPDAAANDDDHGIFLPLVLRGADGTELRFISAVTNFGTPADVTLAELSLETFFPADDATRRALSRDATGR
jgi:transcriptional regulator with XRE-family HTH domain